MRVVDNGFDHGLELAIVRARWRRHTVIGWPAAISEHAIVLIQARTAATHQQPNIAAELDVTAFPAWNGGVDSCNARFARSSRCETRICLDDTVPISVATLRVLIQSQHRADQYGMAAAIDRQGVDLEQLGVMAPEAIVKT